jgi:hypothetical protein
LTEVDQSRLTELTVDLPPDFASERGSHRHFWGVSAVSDPTDLISISAYASEKGLTKQAISKAVKKLAEAGRLETRKVGRDLLFSRSAFERARCASADPARELATAMAKGDMTAPEISISRPGEPAAVPPPDDPYRQAAADEKKIRARKAQLELDQLEGKLVDRDQVVRAQLHAARTVRNAVMTACKTAADRLVSLPDVKDARTVTTLLQTTFKEALTVLADAMPTWKGAQDGSPEEGAD